MRSIGNKTSKLVTACYQDQASWGSWQERSYLIDITSVIQHYEYSASGEHAPVEGGQGIKARREPYGRDPECFKESSDGVGSRHRKPAWIKAPQVRVELPVREPICHLMGPMYHQCRLPDSGHPGYY